MVCVRFSVLEFFRLLFDMVVIMRHIHTLQSRFYIVLYTCVYTYKDYLCFYDMLLNDLTYATSQF